MAKRYEYNFLIEDERIIELPVKKPSLLEKLLRIMLVLLKQ